MTAPVKPLSSLSDDELAALIRRQREWLPDVPLALQQSLVALWHSAPRPMLQRIVALLSFDSWAAPALPAGVRSLTSPTRHLLYSAQGRDVDLRITPQGDAYVLTGQILGPDERGHVELTESADPDVPGSVAHQAELNALGEFQIDGVARGRYQLTLSVADTAIDLPPFDVGPAGGGPR